LASPRLSVLLSTHNPHPDRLARTLDSIFSQMPSAYEWELVVIDNASNPPLDAAKLELGRHPYARLLREERLGLLFGRLAGLDNSKGDLILFCDDDNVLAGDFLARAVEIFSTDPHLGNASGKCFPEFETTPPAWAAEFEGCLALRNFGDVRQVGTGWSGSYPDFAFGGGGAVFRREALAPFLTAFKNGADIGVHGRTGIELTSGEDNNFILSVLKAGFHVGYFPELVMTHLIPAQRLNKNYLGRLNHGIAKSWVQVLALHGICPWTPVDPWTVPLRKCRAYFRYHAWAGPSEYVRWRGACGHFEGRALIGRQKIDRA
jgi:glycosyltransferase involved in cell wall biosynthesis